MTDKLTPVSWNRFVSRMNKLGFSGPISGGKHPKMQKGSLTITIPNKHESEIGAGFLRRLLNQAGITKDEWLSV